MKIEYQYSNQKHEINVPEDTQVINPNKVEVSNAKSEILNALKNPKGCKGLADFLENKNSILIIVNDGTRPTPTFSVMEILKPILNKQKISVIIATGCHRAAREDEKKKILGNTYSSYSSCTTSHDSRDEKSLVFLGTSKNGTPLSVNRALFENDGVIIIGSVEPHYFAGYTGGRKAIMPGIASYESIEKNHKMALAGEAKSRNLIGNPVHQDMIDILSLIKDVPIFSIQTVMDSDHQVYKTFAGDLVKSFDAAIKAADEVFAVSVKEKADIVISVAKSPMDLDLYQSQKAIDNGKLALKKGGILIFVAACKDGIGSQPFYKLLSNSDTPSLVLDKIKKEYQLGYHKAGKMAEIMEWATIYGVSTLQSEILKNIFITKFETLEEALEKAISIKGKEAKIVILTDGCVTVPSIVKQ